ncbi:MAG: HAAAP family serine/threonine permease [Neisseriaceae bacterium]|nr:HAAAP family serine/threonine permease [Neisseriaceae bacterium]
MNALDKADPHKWHGQDTIWLLGMFGTAIGAGVLFLPINAGIGGLWPLLIVTALAFPITYFAHRALARFVGAADRADEGIVGVVAEYFGPTASKVFTLVYFFAIYTILLMYAVAITNTAISFMVHQLHLAEPSRALVAMVLILGLMAIVRLGQSLIMRIMSWLTYPFIASLWFMGLYLIPQWNGAIFQEGTAASIGATGSGVVMTLWMAFPVLVMSFNHYPIISPFVVAQRQRYGKASSDAKCRQIQRYSYLLMVTTVLFFVYSCILSVSPAGLAEAKQQNISILSYLANHFDTPILSYLAPMIAFVAITKSFLGHYVGAYDAMREIVLGVGASRQKTLSTVAVNRIIFVFMIVTCWVMAYFNPSILTIIERISGPTGAVILLLLPMYAIHKLPALAAYKGRMSNVFVTVIGLVTVSAIFYGMFV